MEFEDLEPRFTQILPLSQKELASMSVSELEERVSELRIEIGRCEVMIEAKKGSRAGAEAFFKQR